MQTQRAAESAVGEHQHRYQNALETEPFSSLESDSFDSLSSKGLSLSLACDEHGGLSSLTSLKVMNSDNSPHLNPEMHILSFFPFEQHG